MIVHAACIRVDNKNFKDWVEADCKTRMSEIRLNRKACREAVIEDPRSTLREDLHEAKLTLASKWGLFNPSVPHTTFQMTPDEDDDDEEEEADEVYEYND